MTRAYVQLNGIAPRLALAVLPGPLGTWLSGAFGFTGCFFSQSPFCIYVWHEPFVDVFFGALVLAPFITTRRLWPLRVVGLIMLSVLVHALSVGQLVNFRGTLMIPGVSTAFLDIVPIAIIASLVLAGATRLIAALTANRRYYYYAAAAGLPPSAVFLGLEFWGPVFDRFDPTVLVWITWHASLCAAIFYGLRPVRA